ncbi:MAG: SRPBCC domain-containing protein [Rhodobacteraceae bacterium]|nr:SRPBCC domain-containing protein [Paracoccaceae bacterium]
MLDDASLNSIDLATDLAVPLPKAWAVLTEQKFIADWFGDHVKLDAHVGGTFRETWQQDGRTIITSGTVIDLAPPFRIAWTWADDDWSRQTIVVFYLHIPEDGDGSTCHLHLSHSGWAALRQNRDDGLRLAHEAGWRHHLSNLRTYCENL